MLHHQWEQPISQDSSQPGASRSHGLQPILSEQQHNRARFQGYDAAAVQEMIQHETALTHYPSYEWELASDASNSHILKPQKTISRHLVAHAGTEAEYEGELRHIGPYGDRPAQIAVLRTSLQPQIIRNAYALSALRFKLSPFGQTKSTRQNGSLGIPTSLRDLFQQLSTVEQPSNTAEFLFQQRSWFAFNDFLNSSQRQSFVRYANDLVPHMNANPFNPEQHEADLSRDMIHDLKQYVELQNKPFNFFHLMQWIERDVAIARWRSFFHRGQYLSVESALILVMRSWRDRQGERRKKPINCPVGVPIGYMQAIRRKNQPFISPEFADHSHGALNHWLQEHLWQRFYARYPEQCSLAPSDFFKGLGYVHFAFADSLYELHMPNVVNPANTHFWRVLQYYLPLMSPWP